MKLHIPALILVTSISLYALAAPQSRRPVPPALVPPKLPPNYSGPGMEGYLIVWAHDPATGQWTLLTPPPPKVNPPDEH